MKASVYILLLIMALVFAADHALAGCDCRQPAYKDQIDFFTRYMACLDDCLNTQMQQVRLDIQTTEQRMSDLEAEIDRLNLKINHLENERRPGPEEK